MKLLDDSISNLKMNSVYNEDEVKNYLVSLIEVNACDTLKDYN